MPVVSCRLSEKEALTCDLTTNLFITLLSSSFLPFAFPGRRAPPAGSRSGLSISVLSPLTRLPTPSRFCRRPTRLLRLFYATTWTRRRRNIELPMRGELLLSVVLGARVGLPWTSLPRCCRDCSSRCMSRGCVPGSSPSVSPLRGSTMNSRSDRSLACSSSSLKICSIRPGSWDHDRRNGESSSNKPR